MRRSSVGRGGPAMKQAARFLGRPEAGSAMPLRLLWAQQQQQQASPRTMAPHGWIRLPHPKAVARDAGSCKRGSSTVTSADGAAAGALQRSETIAHAQRRAGGGCTAQRALPPAQVIEVEEIAAHHRRFLREEFAGIRACGVEPTLVGILAESSDQPARNYVEWTRRACEDIGVSFRLHETSSADVFDTLRTACQDPLVHGIMVYYPCLSVFPAGIAAGAGVAAAAGSCEGVGGVGGRSDAWQGGGDQGTGRGGERAGALTDDVLRNEVPVRKDVEALSEWYQDALYRDLRTLDRLPAQPGAGQGPPPVGSKCLVPCAPLAVIKILEYLQVYDDSLAGGSGLSGQRVAVLNRSRVVGLPLAAMLANDGAHVHSIDSITNTVYAHSRGSDVAVALTAQVSPRAVDPVRLYMHFPIISSWSQLDAANFITNLRACSCRRRWPVRTSWFWALLPLPSACQASG